MKKFIFVIIVIAVIIAILSLQKFNLTSMLIWVLVGNKYARFYEDLGGQQVYRKAQDFGEFTTDNNAYGWKDLDDISFGEGVSLLLNYGYN